MGMKTVQTESLGLMSEETNLHSSFTWNELGAGGRNGPPPPKPIDHLIQDDCAIEHLLQYPAPSKKCICHGRVVLNSVQYLSFPQNWSGRVLIL